jgi:hypothetical protein
MIVGITFRNRQLTEAQLLMPEEFYSCYDSPTDQDRFILFSVTHQKQVESTALLGLSGVNLRCC